MGGKKKSSASKTEAKRQGQIKQGVDAINTQFAQFDEPFYQNIGNEYMAFARPQLDDQYTEAAKQLQFALARQYGTTDTSEAAARNAKLAKAKADAEAQLADQSLGYQNQQRQSVEDQRNNLIAQVTATADPSAAASSALNQAQILHKSPQFSQLGDLFSNITEGLAAASYPYGLGGAITKLFGGDGTSSAMGNKKTQQVI